MESPLNAWIIIPLIACLFLDKAAHAETDDYAQLKSRIERLEKEITILRKQQNKTKPEQHKKVVPTSKILNDKKLLAILEKWSKENSIKKETKKKPVHAKLVRKQPRKNTITQKDQAKNKLKNTNKLVKKQAKKRPKNRSKLTKKRPIPAKRALFPPAGKIKVNLQYSVAETTGRQLSVDGFSLLPIFVVGNITSQDVVSTSHTTNLSISRTLSKDSQIRLNIPYSQKSEELTNDAGQTTKQTRRKSKGLGDIRLTYSKQILKNTHKLPHLIGAVTWKTTTGKDTYEDPKALALGSGFNAIRVGITTIKQDDPAVLFASTGYTLNMKDNKGSFGNVDPGDTYDLALGIVYSLTDKLSMNFGLEQAWTTKTTIDNENVINSDPHTAALSVGAKVKLSNKRSINIRTKIGLNESTPGFQMQIGVPLKN